jgi:hypothetical protein
VPDECRDVLRAVTGVSAAAGQLLRGLLDDALTPGDAVILGEALVDAGQALRRYGRTQQDGR